MAEIVNLRRRRKELVRRARENEAQANRLRFGRTKAEKAADTDKAVRERRTLDDRRLDTHEDEE
ncbi:MAG: DUF4169 family protein [Proteobacteria bacterium]|nr:DUF4169 family protein [Pseudomonadota bacterium]